MASWNTYTRLNINKKINLKSNIVTKGLKYGTIPNNWVLMKMPLIWD